MSLHSKTPAPRLASSHGVDYEETYAPVVKFASVRIMLATVATQDLDLHQMDVVTAFLHSDRDKGIYIEVSASFKDLSQPDVCVNYRRLSMVLEKLRACAMPRLTQTRSLIQQSSEAVTILAYMSNTRERQQRSLHYESTTC